MSTAIERVEQGMDRLLQKIMVTERSFQTFQFKANNMSAAMDRFNSSLFQQTTVMSSMFRDKTAETGKSFDALDSHLEHSGETLGQWTDKVSESTEKLDAVISSLGELAGKVQGSGGSAGDSPKTGFLENTQDIFDRLDPVFGTLAGIGTVAGWMGKWGKKIRDRSKGNDSGSAPKSPSSIKPAGDDEYQPLPPRKRRKTWLQKTWDNTTNKVTGSKAALLRGKDAIKRRKDDSITAVTNAGKLGWNKAKETAQLWSIGGKLTLKSAGEGLQRVFRSKGGKAGVVGLLAAGATLGFAKTAHAATSDQVPQEPMQPGFPELPEGASVGTVNPYQGQNAPEAGRLPSPETGYWPEPPSGAASDNMARDALLSAGSLVASTKVVAKRIPGLNAAFSVAEVAGAKDKKAAAAEAGFGLAGSVTGGAIGAAIGTAILPGVGTAIGGFLGSTAGDIAGRWLGRKLFGKKEQVEPTPPPPPPAPPVSPPLDLYAAQLRDSSLSAQAQMGLYEQRMLEAIQEQEQNYQMTVGDIQIVMPEEKVDKAEMARWVSNELTAKIMGVLQNRVMA